MLVTSAPVLRGFDKRHPIHLSTDASGYAIGAVLEQDDGQGTKPVAYFSQVLNIHEQRYSIRERELLAAVNPVATGAATYTDAPLLSTPTASPLST